MTSFADSALTFEPYLPLFTPAAGFGLAAGAAVGVAALLLRRTSRAPGWRAYALTAAGLLLGLGVALAAQAAVGLAVPGAAAPWSVGLVTQAAAGLLLGWGLTAMVGTYQGIYERSGRRLAWGLLALRIVGVLLLLAVLANPVWKRREVEPGRVVVVVDDSRSMSLPAAGGGTRFDRAREAVEKLRAALDADKNKPHVVVDLYDINGRPLAAWPAAPAAGRTDLTLALREADLRTQNSRLTTALVLVSDGMDTTGRKDFRGWEGASVPLFALGFAKEDKGDLDLAVRKPTAPERARVRNDVTVDVPVVKTGKAAAEATVALKLGRDVLASQAVHFGPGPGERVVSLTFRPEQAGDFVLTASVEAAAGEADLGNNAAQFPLRVDADPIRVLYVEGYLRYEYKYLKRRLEEDPDVSLKAAVRVLNPEQPGGGKPEKDLLTDDELKQTAVVVLGDMEGRFLSPAEYRALGAWLKEKKDDKYHSLLVLGGYRSFGPDGFRGTPLAADLPVLFADGPPYQSEEPFRLQLTDKGRSSPVFALTGDPARDAESWAAAPALEGMSLVKGVSPAGEELAVHPGLLVDGKPAVAAAVARAPGGGQVLVLAVDSTWRWSRLPRVAGEPDTLYTRFWGQAVRFLAGRTRAEQRPPLTVTTDRPYYDLNQRVRVTVRRGPDAGWAAKQLKLEITGPGGPLPADRTPAPAASSGEPDVFAAEFLPPAAGRYDVNAVVADAADAAKTVANATAEFRAQGADYELADTGTNPAALKALAEAGGGQYLDVDQADRLAALVARKERLGPERSWEYWNSPLLFVAFLTCVSAEWILRRWNQLV
jgi:hypothetical protein